ncbi:MAG: DMT family transporter [Rhodobacteraceae bacterium]|nr:DMT family transporter [Paracoccaceae bacterium]
MKSDWLPYALVAFLVIVWGSAFGLTTVALEGFSPVETSFGRTALAAVVVAIVAIVSGQGIPNTLLEWRWLSLLGIVGLAAPVTLLSWAQVSIPGSVASIFISSVPLFILLATRVILREPVSRRKWTGFAIGFTGLVWLAGPAAISQVGAEGQALAQLSCILVAMGYASGGIVIKVMPSIPPFRATAGTMIAGAVFLLPFGYSAFETALGAPLVPLIALIALGILPSGIGQNIRYVVVKRKGPVFMSVVGFLIPVWAGFVGFFILDEPLTLHTVSAYSIILIGLLISRDRVKKAQA